MAPYPHCNMPYEVELKFRAENHAAVERRLAPLGARAAPAVEQEDVYLKHPARDFAVTGEAFRVRREGVRNRLTYKGPKHAGPTKTREELEIPFEDGPKAFELCLQLFGALGFAPVKAIRKLRTSFHLEYGSRALEVALDLAEGLGTFVEVETIAADAADLPAAQEAILACANELGLTEVEPRSYLRMALEQSGEMSRDAAVDRT